MKPSSDLRDLLTRRMPGYGLEASFYTDPSIFEKDIEIIFKKHWIFVAPEPSVQEPGDYITVKVGGNSILLVRNDDMQIRAFHNVCRHRGTIICQADKGFVGNIVCPYHQWTYNLEGSLIFAEGMGADFDAAKHSLKPVHVKNIGGLLFICLADEPPADIDEMAKTMEPYVSKHRLPECKVAKQIDIVEDCNWKLVVENNRECYHCSANHPELSISLSQFILDEFDPADPNNSQEALAYQDVKKERYAKWAKLGLPFAEVEHLDNRVTGFRTERFPLANLGSSHTMTTGVACKKLLGNFEDAVLGDLSYWTQPNSWHHFMSDHVITFSVMPIAVDKTLVRTTWLVHKDAVEGVDYDLENLTKVWLATNAQDKHLAEEVHRGALSDAYQPGPLSPKSESYVNQFGNWYIDRLSAFVE